MTSLGTLVFLEILLGKRSHSALGRSQKDQTRYFSIIGNKCRLKPPRILLAESDRVIDALLGGLPIVRTSNVVHAQSCCDGVHQDAGFSTLCILSELSNGDLLIG